MNAGELLGKLLRQPPDLNTLDAPLTDETASEVIAALKAEVDRHWYIDANRSLELADLIIRIGEAREDQGQIALGMMARGDSLRILGHIREAWVMLERAGCLFREAGDEIGWARTRIGRLTISVDLDCVDAAIEEAQHAREVFDRYREHELLLRLLIGIGMTYNLLGKYQQALASYSAALEIAGDLGGEGEAFIGGLYLNIGYAYDYLGDFRNALDNYERAYAICAAQKQTVAAIRARLSIAYMAFSQGRYRHALNLLYQIADSIDASLLWDLAKAQQNIIECYLYLNRYQEARELAREVYEQYEKLGGNYDKAITLGFLAMAEAGLSNYEVVEEALDKAQSIFASVGASSWAALMQLYRGRIANRQGDVQTARREANSAIATFRSGKDIVNYGRALLLKGQSLFAIGQQPEAREAAGEALDIARKSNVPPLRYSAHMLLGGVCEAEHKFQRAIRHYLAATATIDRLQRDLTITLRPDFLEDKNGSLHSLLRLYLNANQADCAFEALERAKSRVLLGYLANQENLRWSIESERARKLLRELNDLRAEHQWFYQMAHGQPTGQEREKPSRSQFEQALHELAIRERRMRAITEQLYLQAGENSRGNPGSMPSLRDIQSSLSDEEILVEYYNDGSCIRAFLVDREELAVYTLPKSLDLVDQLLRQFQFNLDCALQVAPDDMTTAKNLTALMKRILAKLWEALIQPFHSRLQNRKRLIIVPYGSLHYLPFSLLYAGSAYLIENHEVAILPAAGLATRRGAKDARKGALILGHSWDGRLAESLAEARLVQNLTGGELYTEELARRASLQTPPRQILHIAAHGEHRMDQPDLSHIQLGDGQLYTDDLLQNDLRYELVVLSACESGRARVAPGDELIGLGRGFLYAGTEALIASLWRVEDRMTVRLMEYIYRALLSGASRAAAIRDAQCLILSENPDLHPVFWGAFQLIGDPGALSTVPDNWRQSGRRLKDNLTTK